MIETPRMRLFIALETPDSVRTELIRAQEDLRRALRVARLRWTLREQLHLTLCFLA